MKTLYSLKWLLFLTVVISSASVYAQVPCTPTYSFACTSDDYINNFSTTGGQTNITNNNTGCSNTSTNYTYFSTMTVSINPSTSFNFSVQGGPSWSQGHRIWVDWNNDGDFSDPGEDCWNSGGSSTSIYTGTIVAPATAISGVNLRMRVRCSYAGVPTDPCSGLSFGEAEDYNVRVLAGKNNDAGVTSIDSPAGGCEGDYNVLATIRNFGKNQIDSVTVNWSFNSILQTPFISYALLDTNKGLGSQTVQVTLGTVTLTGGVSDTIVVWTSLPNNKVDSASSNDSAITIYNSLSTITSFPYVQDFENGQGEWYTAGPNSTWAFGTPAKSVIVGAASGTNAFVTGGLSTSQYNASEISWVGSPCFDLSEFEGTPWVALDIWWNSEFGYDGAVLQTSINGGVSWQNVGKFQDPNNWYNNSNLYGNPAGQKEGWSGTNNSSSGGWVTAKHAMNKSLVGKNIQMRVAFGSDPSVGYDGVAFDNVRIVDFRKPDLGPDEISLCGKNTRTLDPNIPINGDIAWSTGDSSSLSIVVSTLGSYWVSYRDSIIDEVTGDTVKLIQSAPLNINFAKLTDTISIDGSVLLDPNLPFNIDYNWTPGNFNYPYLNVKGSDVGLGVHIYTLAVVDSVECTDEQDVVVVVLDFTGINEETNGELSVYPNPVDSKLILDIRNANSGKVLVTIFDLQGKEVFMNNFGTSGSNRIELDLSNIPSGAYIVRVNSDNETFVRQIIKN